MKQIVKRSLRRTDQFLYYLLENGANLKITGLNWRAQPGRLGKSDAYSSKSEDSVPYIEIGPGQYALLEFSKPVDSDSGWIAGIWVEERSTENVKCAELLTLAERYPDPQDELDSVGWSELLTLEARSHNLIVRQDAQDRAIALADKAIALNPKLARAWNAKGAALAVLGRDRDAVQCYLRAIRLDSTFLRSWVNLGNRYNRMGDIERSLFAYRIGAALLPQVEGDQEILQGAVNALKSDSDEAKEVVRLAGGRSAELDAILSKFPDHMAILGTNAHTFIRLNGMEAALRCYDEALQTKSDHPAMLYARALLEDAMDRRGHSYCQFLSVADESLAAHREYAERRIQELDHWQGGNPPATCVVETGTESCGRTEKLPGDSLDVRAHIGVIPNGRFAHLFDCMIARMNFDEDEEDSGFKYAMDNLYLANWTEAQDLFDQVNPGNPHDAAARCNKALCRYALGQYDEAMKVLDGNLKDHPDHVESLVLRAEVLSARGRRSCSEISGVKDVSDEALRHYRKAALADAGHSGALYCRALAEDGMGCTDEAFKTFCQFMVINPGDEGKQVRYARRRLQELAFWKMNRNTGVPAKANPD